MTTKLVSALKIRTWLKEEIRKRYGDKIKPTCNEKNDDIAFVNGTNILLTLQHDAPIEEFEELFIGNPDVDEFIRRARECDVSQISVH